MRLLQLCITLMQGETVTAAELAGTFGVAERTIYRDIEMLAKAQVLLRRA